MSSQYRVVVANNIEEFHARKSRFITQCYQLDKGPFWGKTEVLYDTNITFTRRTVNATILEGGRAPGNLRGFTFHTTGGTFIRNGVAFEAGDTSASCNGDAFVTFIRGGCHYYSLMVSDAYAKKLLSDHDWQSYRKITAEERSIVIKRSSEFACLVALLDNTLDALADGLLMDSDNRAIRAMQQELLRDIVIMIETAKIESLRSNSNHRLLYKASKIVLDMRLKALTVEELARRVGTSRRNLEHVFQSIVGIPPKQFIQSVRLNRIREDLFNQKNLSLIGIAKRYGINHVGHLSGAYKALFEELPSETRARAAAMVMA
jgi:AraC-like DNA-binding protein